MKTWTYRTEATVFDERGTLTKDQLKKVIKEEADKVAEVHVPRMMRGLYQSKANILVDQLATRLFAQMSRMPGVTTTNRISSTVSGKENRHE